MWHVLQKNYALLQIGEVLQLVEPSNTNCGKLIITKWFNRYCKVGQLLQKKTVHLRGTRTNGNPCLPTGSMRFENGIFGRNNFF